MYPHTPVAPSEALSMLSPQSKADSVRHLIRRDGFVLVAVLLLVALVTILVVVASMMSQIERRAAANSAKIEQARGNAIFALDAAINQLQREAGPDQRITARAEILDDTPATSNVTGVSQQYWAGVWKTGSSGLDVVNAGKPQREISLGSITPSIEQKATNAVWLVSGTNAAYNPISFNGTTSDADPAKIDAVVLARNHGAGSANVAVPLVTMQSGASTNGAYAYWVSDEGVKAKVNVKDPTLGEPAGTGAGQLHFHAPQGLDITKGILGTENKTDIRGSTNLTKVTTLQSVSRISGIEGVGGNATSAHLPDATTHSYGVLADVRNGGLKKDLTAALETPENFAALAAVYGNGAGMLYRYATSANMTVPAGDQAVNAGVTDGLPWYSLYFHYNAYKGTMPAPGTTSGNPAPVAPTSSGNPEAFPNVLSPRFYGVKMGPASVDTKQAGIAPMPIAFRVDIALSSYNNGSASAPDWRLRLHYYPQLVLYNPYSVRISAADYQFQRNFGAFATAGTYNDTNPTVTCIRVTATTAAGATTVVPYFMVNQASAGRLALKTKLGDCATMEPGETRVFALAADVSKTTPANAINFTDLVSNENMSPDFSQYCDVLTGSNNGTSTGGAFSTPDPNTTIRIDLAAPMLRCQAVDTFINPSRYKWPVNDGSVRVQAGGSYQQKAAAGVWPAGITISQMSGQPRRIIGFYIRQKGLLPSASSYTYANAAVQIPVFHGNYSQFTPLEDTASTPWKEVYLSPFGGNYQNGQTDVQITHPPESSQFWQTSFGDQSAGAGSPGNRIFLRDVPRQPLVSLGQFMHMPALNFLTIGNYAYLAMGSMFVGGSLASPVIATEKNAYVDSAGPTSNTLYLDDSFLSNEALFDRFFLSTMPPGVLNATGTTYPKYWTDFNAANSGAELSDRTLPLLNARMTPYFRNGVPPRLADLRDVKKAAAGLMLEGAFNVNSTSVEAWKALLSSLSGNDLKVWNATAGVAETLSAGTLSNPIPRFWSASFKGGINRAWEGMRALSDSQVQDLAERIVEQVKTRGPFLSMSDFLNRRMGANSPLSRCGALQAAIDNTTPDINAVAKAAGMTINVAVGAPAIITANLQDAKGNPYNTALGIPGYLMQQDLVQAFSPVMVARSDTFVVRCYGEVRNPKSAAIEGRAWGEAVVQRVPDFVDQSDPALTAGDSPGAAAEISSLNPTNKTLGRRFKVVAFRWLNENEI